MNSPDAEIVLKVLDDVGMDLMPDQSEAAESAVKRMAARITELEEELRNIAEADYTKWADDMNTPTDFVAWAKSRARHTLNLK